jgi:S1-C subfamily serine protease
VHAGDLVVAVGAERVSSLAELFRGIWRMGPAGTEIPLTLARSGGPVYVRVNSGDRNDYLKKPSLQ